MVKRARRFYKQNKMLCYICVASIMVVVLRIGTMDVPELFNYGEEIFALMYDLSLTVIGSVIFYYIVDFYSRDRIRENNEEKMIIPLTSINNMMKEIVNTIIGSDLYCNSGVRDIDMSEVENAFEKEEEISSITRLSGGETHNSIGFIAMLENDIYQKIRTMNMNYGEFMSHSDLGLLMSVQDRPMAQKSKLCGAANINCRFNREMVLNHIRIQKKLEKRIREIEAS